MSVEIPLRNVSLTGVISHTKQVLEADILTAKTKEISLTKRVGIYQIDITNQNNEIVALFKGTVYRTGKEWEV